MDELKAVRSAQDARWDVVTFGETMLRLNPAPGSSLEAADALQLHVAGSESNLAVALARLDLRVAWGSRLAQSAPGRRIAAELRRWQVDISQLIWEPEEDGRTGLFYVEYGSSPRATTVLYDRAHSAASHLMPGDVSSEALQSARILHLTGITPALSHSCAEFVRHTAAAARSLGTFISFDVNYRSRLWTPAAARNTLQGMMESIDLLICTQEDAVVLYGIQGSGEETALTLRNLLRVPAVVVTCGADGAYGRTASGSYYAHGLAIGPPVDRLGAGDAFAAGLLYGVLNGDIEQGLRFGMAMAALKHSYTGDLLLATGQEIRRVAEGGFGGLQR